LRSFHWGYSLHLQPEGRARGFFRLAGALFEKAAERQLRNDLETLKDLLEASKEPLKRGS
jgi:hypothetical protein